MKKQKGFSLIELLIVVAIILIIAAIAIPNLLKSRIAANESSAVAAVRTIATSEITYFTSNNTYGTLANLGPTSGVGLIDQAVENATAAATAKSGYFFTVTPTASTFFVLATPSQVSVTGVRYFCAVEDAVLHGQTTTFGSHDDCYNAKVLGQI